MYMKHLKGKSRKGKSRKGKSRKNNRNRTIKRGGNHTNPEKMGEIFMEIVKVIEEKHDHIMKDDDETDRQIEDDWSMVLNQTINDYTNDLLVMVNSYANESNDEPFSKKRKIDDGDSNEKIKTSYRPLTESEVLSYAEGYYMLSKRKAQLLRESRVNADYCEGINKLKKKLKIYYGIVFTKEC